MRLWILRHAHASPATGTADDSERTLSERGIREAESVARTVRRIARPDLILHSPYMRAFLTAEAVARLFPGIPCESNDQLISDRKPSDVAEFLSTMRNREIILVSHEPLTSDLSGWLIAGDVAGQISFPPATFALIDTGDGVAAGKGTLLSLCPPEFHSDKDMRP